AFQVRLTAAPYGAPRQVQMRMKAPIGVQFGRRRIGTRGFRLLGWYVSQQVLEPFATDFRHPGLRSERPFHEPPPAKIWPGQSRVILAPRDTALRFSGWKVWLDPGSLQMLGPEPAQFPPIWCFESPAGLVRTVPATQI